MWKTGSVENAECGKCGVLKKNILKGYKKVKRKNKVISPHVLNYIRYNILCSSPAHCTDPGKGKLLLTKSKITKLIFLLIFKIAKLSTRKHVFRIL